MKILFVCHRLPYPPNRGGKIRPFNMIRHLSRKHSVVVASLAHTEQELKEIREMKEASGSGEIVTTEKDFFRCEELINKIFRPLVLKVRLRFTSGEDVLARRLDELVGAPNAIHEVLPLGALHGKIS